MSMKDKLRELAEMVREAYRAGFIAACKWPEPVSQDVDSSAYNKEFNAWSFSVREKHAAILDAEGDGGAAGDVVSLESAMRAISHVDQHNGPGRANQAHAMLQSIARPARSGVVSDEDVDGFIEALKNKGLELIFEEDRPYIRAALELFAKGERHDSIGG